MNTPTNSEALPPTSDSPSSGTPRCDLLERTTLNPADWMALARTLENEAEFYKSALLHAPVVDAKELRKRLYELPELVLANEKKNPAWSKAELWGIERDIIPSVRMLCWSAAALLPENDQTHLNPTPSSAVEGILARLPKGCTGVLASTQYGMGFILTEQNEIVFRDDSLSHEVRKILAKEVNAEIPKRI